MSTCYAYLRVSTEEQANHGYSLENQKLVCKAYAETNGYSLGDVFIDEGKTARNTNREQFQAMMSAIKAKPVNAIIVNKLDRLFRSLKDFSTTVEYLRKHNIKLMSVAEGDVTEGILGKILASIAEHESEMIGKRTADGMRQKFREGFYPGKAPYGYMNVEKDEKRVVAPDPVTAPLMVELFEKYSTGQYSMLELCEMLFEKGLADKSGKPLAVQTVCETLASPFYYGLMEWGGMTGMGNHKPLISKGLFDQCQYVVSKHKHFLLRKSKNFFLLRGFLYCPTHEKRMTADLKKKINSQKRTSIGYYRCCNAKGCKPSYVEREKIERKIANLFKRYQFSEDFIQLVKEEARKHLSESGLRSNAERQSLINQRKGIELKRANLESLIVEGTIDREVFKRQHAQLEAQIIQIETKLRELDDRHSIDFSVIEEILALTRNIHQTYLDAPDFLKRHYLRLFFEKIYVQDEKIVKLIESPIFKTLREEQKLLIRSQWGA